MIKYIKTAIWASLAVISLVAAFLTFRHSFSYKMPPFLSFVKVLKNVNPITQIFSSSQDLTATSTPNSTTTPTTLKSNPKAKQIIPSYGDAVLFYQNRRIQFNQDCQAIPSLEYFVNGVTIMLDNRSPDTKKIVLGGKVYNVAGYNYVLVTLKEKKLPASFYIKCGNLFNTAEVILE